MAKKDRYIPLGIKHQCAMRQILTGLAQAYGIGEEVSKLLDDRQETRLQDWPLSRLLKNSRKITGYTKSDVNRRGGPSRVVLLSLEEPTEKNRIRNPTVSHLFKVAKGYDIPPALILNASLQEAGLLNEPGALGDIPVRVRRRSKRL
ncbi:hypothetical protein [Pseudotabrizicola alkalilacus]|uniref:Uncharacterized protein n=1 Tax=Pseudotabrizicola alkalilacus TaxID=2305252 RepID=A0A411Z869_9RHOB|nr:hypothetical protein [Pseudotabrizicola alkalilacus]RGP39233.1 hypothetical protein D1012_03780 [Pseudotabrizicola alkalilacus]